MITNKLSYFPFSRVYDESEGSLMCLDFSTQRSHNGIMRVWGHEEGGRTRLLEGKQNKNRRKGKKKQQQQQHVKL